MTLHTPHCYQCESVVTQRSRLTECLTRRRLGGVASCSGQSIPRAASSPCEANGGYATATWPPGGASSKAPGHWRRLIVRTTHALAAWWGGMTRVDVCAVVAGSENVDFAALRARHEEIMAEHRATMANFREEHDTFLQDHAARMKELKETLDAELPGGYDGEL